MLSFLIFYRFGGDFSFDAFARTGAVMPGGWQSAAFVLALVGLAPRPVVPLPCWLPQAHPAAPSHVSALMFVGSNDQDGRLRVGPSDFHVPGGPAPSWWGVVVLVVGTVSALLGVMYALMGT